MKDLLIEITNRVFQNLLVIYLLMLLVNEFKLIFYPGTTNTMLVIIIILGVITALFSKPHEEEHTLTKLDTVFIIALGIIGTVLVFIKTKELGVLSYLISLISGVLIILLGFLVYQKQEHEAKFDLKFNLKFYYISFVVLMVLCGILSFFVGWEAFRIVWGSVFVLFLPGFILSYVFFDRIDSLERIALSFALSISVVPLVVFYLNLLGMKINAVNVSLVILVICGISFVIYKKKHNFKFLYDYHKAKRALKHAKHN